MSLITFFSRNIWLILMSCQSGFKNLKVRSFLASMNTRYFYKQYRKTILKMGPSFFLLEIPVISF